MTSTPNTSSQSAPTRYKKRISPSPFCNLNAETKGLVMVLVPLIFELLFVGVFALMLQDTIREFDEISRTRKMLGHLHDETLTCVRGILGLGLSGDSPQEQRAEIDGIIKRVEKQRHQPDTTFTAPELKVEGNELLDRLIQFLTDTRKRLDNEKFDFALPAGRFNSSSSALMSMMDYTAFNTHVLDMEKTLGRAEPQYLEHARWRIGILLFTSLAISVFVSIAFAKLFTADFALRLGLIEQNANALATGNEMHDIQAGTDEIAQLDRVLHESRELLLQSRKKELAILDNAADVICSLNSDLRFSAVGASSEKIWNCKEDDLLGGSLLSMLSRDSVDSVRNAFKRISAETGEGSVETVIVVKGGGPRIFLWTVKWSEVQANYYCVVHDITERKSIDRLKQTFVSMVSHDLRTPLTSVNFALSGLANGKRGPLSRAASSLVQRSQTNMNRLMGLVNELLELHKFEAGKMTLAQDCLSASELCLSALEQLSSSAAAADIEIQEPMGDAALRGDEDKLTEVMVKLIANAIRFAPQHSAITLGVRTVGKMVEISVSDEGSKVREEHRLLIFDKFHSSRELDEHGRSGGLGLAIVKSIVEAHEGEVGVFNNHELGATFWVRIPEFEDEGEV